LATSEQILDFWFGDSLTRLADLSGHATRWFDGGPEFDRMLAFRFGADIERAGQGQLDCWTATSRGRLALILLLDQFTRNAWRGSARAYLFDARAVALCREGLESGADLILAPLEREFFYMPLLHAERLDDQRLGLICFKRLLAEAPTALVPHFRQSVATARRHRAIIGRFGRFPHRNDLLGRQSAFSEHLFLAVMRMRRRAATPFARLASLGRY
jgi:uncharacterized protein (DUF924 family)